MVKYKIQVPNSNDEHIFLQMTDLTDDQIPNTNTNFKWQQSVVICINEKEPLRNTLNQTSRQVYAKDNKIYIK
jgi:hypothetical protein